MTNTLAYSVYYKGKGFRAPDPICERCHMESATGRGGKTKIETDRVVVQSLQDSWRLFYKTFLQRQRILPFSKLVCL